MPTFLWDNPGEDPRRRSLLYDWGAEPGGGPAPGDIPGMGVPSMARPGQALNREIGRRQSQGVQSRQNQGRGLAARRAGAAQPTEQRVTGAPNNLPIKKYGLTGISGSSPIIDPMPAMNPFVANRGLREPIEAMPNLQPSIRTNPQTDQSYESWDLRNAPLPNQQFFEGREPEVSLAQERFAGQDNRQVGQNLEPSGPMGEGMDSLATARQQFSQAIGKTDRYAELKARFAAPPDPTAVANAEFKKKGILGRLGQIGLGALKGLAIGGPGGAIAGGILGGTGDVYRTERVAQLQAQDARNRQAGLDQFGIMKAEDEAVQQERNFQIQEEKMAGYRQVNAARDARQKAQEAYQNSLIREKQSDRQARLLENKIKAEEAYRNKLFELKGKGWQLPPELEQEFALEGFKGPEKAAKPQVNRYGQLLVPDKDARGGYRYIDIEGFKMKRLGGGRGGSEKLKKSDVRDEVLGHLENEEKKAYMQDKVKEAVKAFRESPEYKAAESAAPAGSGPAYIASLVKEKEAAFVKNYMKTNESKIDRGFTDRLRDTAAGRAAQARQLVNDFLRGKGKSLKEQKEQRNYDLAHPDIETDYDDPDYEDLDEDDE